MQKEKIERAIKLFRHRQKEAEDKVRRYNKSPASMFVSGSAKAYEFCADYLEANLEK